MITIWERGRGAIDSSEIPRFRPATAADHGRYGKQNGPCRLPSRPRRQSYRGRRK